MGILFMPLIQYGLYFDKGVKIDNRFVGLLYIVSRQFALIFRFYLFDMVIAIVLLK